MKSQRTLWAVLVLQSLLARPLNAEYKLVNGMPSCWDSPGLTNAKQPDNYFQPRELEFKKNEKSWYAKWIEHDLRHWRKSGFTEDILNAAEKKTHECRGDRIRFWIIKGALYVKHITPRPKTGWFPSEHKGEAFAKARVPYGIFAILEVLRLFPGQIPDLEAILQTADFTCVQEAKDPAEPAPPTFGYTTAEGFVDIPFPDPGWWGNEYHFIQEPGGKRPQGWERQWQYFQVKWENVTFAHRVPAAMWRGRVDDDWDPSRDVLRRNFVGCVDYFNKQNRPYEASLINVRGPKDVCLHDTCDFRYPVYLESKAYSGSLRYKLSCGSVMMMNRPEFREWWVRDLRPGVHYVEIELEEADAMCESLVRKINQMNSRVDTVESKAQREAARRQSRSARKVHTSNRYRGYSGADYHNFRTVEEEVLGSSSADWLEHIESTVQRSDTSSWGTNLQPWEIALAAREHLRHRVRMEDVYLYIRDVLIAYGKLMRYRPRPPDQDWVVCYSNGSALLEQWGAVHREDQEEMDQQHPWLRDYQQCLAEEVLRPKGWFS